MKSIISELNGRSIPILSHESLWKISSDNWIAALDWSEHAAGYAFNASQILTLNPKNISQILEYNIQEPNWSEIFVGNELSVTEDQNLSMRELGLSLDGSRVEENLIWEIVTLKLKIAVNSIYDEIHLILNGNEVDVTNYKNI